ncbi:MAG: hypothetical protein ACOC1K_06640 [Nanoarchaeota archaeon]
MKKFLSKLSKVVPLKFIVMLLISALIGLGAHLFGAFEPMNWVFWSVIAQFGLMILYVQLRSLWWWITGKGYDGDKNQ